MRNLIAIGMITAACMATPSNAKKAAAPVNPLSKYQAMAVPRSEVPIGAEWLVGIGPNGEGTPAGNISISKGLSAVALSEDTKKKISFALGSFLGLNSDKAQKLEAKYADLEIHRVRSFGALETVVAGQDLLYEAVKVRNIEITVEEGSVAGIQAAANVKGVPLSAGASKDGKRTLTIDGSNLFVAYQAVRISPATTKTTKAFISKDGSEATVDNYRFKFNNSFFTQCRCVPFDQDLPAECGGPGRPPSVPIKLVVYDQSSPTLAGSFKSQTFDLYPYADSKRDYFLEERRTTNAVSVARAKIAYSMATSMGGGICIVDFDKKYNWVELTSSTFKITPLATGAMEY